MAQEIGVAYVSLLPSGTGFSKAVSQEADRSFGAAEKSSRGFFSSLAGGVGRVFAGVGLVAGTVGAIALGGGISRALNIEDATAKLKGLGHDTQAVESIMKDALASVKGTAFGLDTAATVAATAVAAGIKPGQELERYLRLTADAATIAGISMEEMGSILNKTTTAGKVYTQELNQLADRGLPIFQWLQDAYGVTAEELRKMVERGEVDAATFRRVIEENIGGAALASGETTRGALANVGASLSRLGALFAGPALGVAKDFFNEIIALSDGIATRLSPAVERFQFAVDGIDLQFAEPALALIDKLSAGFSGIGETFSGLSGLTPIFTSLAGALAPLLGSLPLIGKFLPAISGPVGAIIGLIAGLLVESEPLRESLAGLAEEIGGSLATAFGSAGGALSGFAPLVSEVLQVLGAGLADAITAVTPAVGVLIEGFGKVWEAITPLFEPLMSIVTAVLSLLGPLGELVGAVLPPLVELFMSVLGPVVELAGVILDALLPVINGLVEVLTGLINFVVGVFTGNWETAWAGIQQAFSGVAAVIGAVINGVWSTLSAVWQAIIGVLNGVIGWLGSTFSGAWLGLVGFFSGIWANINSAIQTAWTAALLFLGSVPDQVMGFFAGIGTWLLDSGKALIQGFIDGISGMIGAVGDAVSGVMDFASGFFPHSPAKRGPFSGAGWTAVADGGSSLMEQFATGAERYRSEISFANLTGLVGASAVSTGDTYVQNPFTGEYLLARVDSRADARVKAKADADAVSYSSGRTSA